MIQYRKFVVSMLLHISGSEVTDAIRKSEDIENDIAKVAPFDKGEHGSFAMRDRSLELG